MINILKPITAAALAVAMMASAANAACVTKAGQGSGGDAASAKFQAWEAVLQSTSWAMWSTWITSGGKVGAAPGYKVSGLKTKCIPAGTTCTIQATLCN